MLSLRRAVARHLTSLENTPVFLIKSAQRILVGSSVFGFIPERVKKTFRRFLSSANGSAGSSALCEENMDVQPIVSTNFGITV